MKTSSFIFVLIVLLMSALDLHGQDSVNHQTVFPAGISIQGGWGHFVVRDEFISKEKYSGPFPYFAAGWSRFHEKYGSLIGFEYRNASRIRNYNISAEITEFSLNLDFLYPVGKFPLFSREIFAYLGPSPELYLHFRRQNIARGGAAIFNAYSVALLISVGLRSEFIYPIKRHLQVESSVQLSVISLGGRFLNPQESDASFIKLLTMLSGMRGRGEVALRYNLINAVSLTVGFRWETTRISAWDYFISSSDNLITTIIYHF